MNNLMMNLSTGNEFAIRAGYGGCKRAVYLGNLRPVGVRLRPDGTISWRDEYKVTFDPKVFSFAVKMNNGYWERRCYTQKSCEEVLASSWKDHLQEVEKEKLRNHRKKTIQNKLISLAGDLFGHEFVEKNYSNGVSIKSIAPEDILVAFRLKNVERTACKQNNFERLSKYDNLHDFSFFDENHGEMLVDAFQRELDKRNQSEVV